ncbi:ribosomal protein S18 acetylase RimI-like enzyme [Rhodovulum bhavnagarense]|uniref:Ribosomal protein S18 acetylase RimI-like enzyme n=1 Tax=Rhodovulum bhavnagarense TaxID=992286 RepID=A0A4R2RHP5_9RHOB|nr:GNAT family N-acetyltransferase [Rhodovulum bhavnagarense]TCP61969.1 ribosomal protein S18 acetylase RimI-like enzyme [Rhodovulum bhavnagarense]
MSDPIIRPLTAADRPDWHRLWTEYLSFYEASVPQSVFETTFSRLLPGGDPEMGCRLAVMGGRPVGLVHFIFHRHCWKPEGVCYLQDLYVDPTLRGTGIGRALVEAVYATADARGVAGVYWMTQSFNATARQLYDRIGQVTPFIKYVRN